ncbi:TfoX family protein [Rhodobacteraceae bacterium RKSG542]|uniref:TfoX/Sxy family protein n=1 Tax=Pseudovibrio flavus TaxID=2529854 RepID=UPI0012BC6736|nr:TfoX/Sxy family protein [Pseudovibrio flavus]MTI18326.1 TfoX family protein [Pseudovibrio flavus]
MAYDEELAHRMRCALEGIVGISEKRMMGALCFMLDGNMVGGATRSKNGIGQFLFRVGKENEAEAEKLPGAEILTQGNKRMSGMFFVNEDDCDDEQMREWISLSLSFVSTLPPKG